MKKWQAFATGAAAGALGIMAVDLVMLGDALAHMRVATNSNGPYKLRLIAVPGTARTGQTAIAQVLLTQSGKPLVNQAVTFTVGSVSKTAQTDISGMALLPITQFSPQSVTVQASWKCPCGKTISDTLTLKWTGPAVQ